MKNLFIAIGLVISGAAFGQIEQNINKTSGTTTNPITEIDSIRFNANQTEMEIIFNNGSMVGHVISDIDDVTFSGQLIGEINGLDCATATITGTLIEGDVASGVSAEISYTGGNGGPHNGQTVTSTGVTGLTATLTVGNFASGSGSLTYDITGTPSEDGIAIFALEIGGQICTLELTVVSLYPIGTVHCNAPTEVVEVINPTTGKTWMDRNLGASQVATSNTDIDAYGDLYQWGRGADGHQCRTSAINFNLSSTDQPGHGDFIVGSIDWRSPVNSSLWQGVNGVNNPCPFGYRLPTETELLDESESWSSSNASGAFDSPLKLPLSGRRQSSSNGDLACVGGDASYWSSSAVSPTSDASRALYFSSSTAFTFTSFKADGRAVRCIKD